MISVTQKSDVSVWGCYVIRALAGRRLRRGIEWMSRDQEFTDDVSVDEVFLDDALEHRGIAGAVPGTFGVHDRDRSTLADAETVRFGSKDAALLGEFQLFEPLLEKRPRGEAAILVAALGLCLIAAQEDMPSSDGHSDTRRDVTLGVGHVPEV